MVRMKLAQLGLLLWKNLLLKKNRPLLTSIEILFPVLFCIYIVILRHVHTNSERPEVFPMYQNVGHVVVGYAPECEATNKFMSAVETLLWKKGYYSAAESFQMVGFKTEYFMMQFAWEHPHFLTHAYAFLEVTNSSKKLPKRLQLITRPVQDPNEDHQFGLHMHENRMLKVIMEAFITEVTGEQQNISVETASLMNDTLLPAEDRFLDANERQLLIGIILAYGCIALSNVYVIASERQSGIVPLLNQMGMCPYMYRTSWYLTVFIHSEITGLCFATIMTVPISGNAPLLTQADPSIVFAYCGLFAMPFTCFCVLGSLLHSYVKTTCVIVGLVWVIALVSVVLLRPPNIVFRVCHALFTDVNLMSFFQIAFAFEHSGDGINWENMEEIKHDHHINLKMLFISLGIATLLYLILAWVLFNWLIQGLPFSEVFELNRLCRCGKKASGDDLDNSSSTEVPSAKDSGAGKGGITVANLICFGSHGKLSDVSLHMVENQVTVLTGFELSGKSALMSILKGVARPYSGTVHVSGMDIVSELPAIRRITGICPRQQQVFFHALTVHQNLTFFAKLKRHLHGDEAVNKFDLERLIKHFQLGRVLDKVSCNLQTANMRLLQVAIPFIGNNKVILLDDPTLNIEPRTRCLLWNVIRKHLVDKTIVVNTDNLEEAEMLGDQIAVFVSGSIHCCGSFEYLKRWFDTGYHLTIKKESRCNVSRIKHLIVDHIKGARFLGENGTSLVFLLPMNATPLFYKLFSVIDTNKSYLQIVDYTVQASTIDEGILRLSYMQEYESAKRRGHKVTQGKNPDVTDDSPSTAEFTRNSCIQLPSSTTSETDVFTSMIRMAGSPIDSKLDPKDDLEERLTYQATLSKPNEGIQDIGSHNDISQVLPPTLTTGWTLTRSQIKALLSKKIIINVSFFRIECIQAIILGILAVWMSHPEHIHPRRDCYEDEVPLYPADLSRHTLVIPVAQGYPKSEVTKHLVQTYKEVVKDLLGRHQLMLVEETKDSRVDTLLAADTLVRSHAEYGATFYTDSDPGELTATAWYMSNDDLEFSQAISLTAVMNTFLLYLTGDSKYYMYPSLRFQHHGYLDRCEIRVRFKQLANRKSHYISSLGVVVLMMVPYFAALERKLGSQHLQYLSGVGPLLYWGITLLFDLLMYVFLCNFYYLIHLCFDSEELEHDFYTIYLIMFLNGVMMHLYIYCIQHLFNSSSTAATTIMFSNFFFSELEAFAALIGSSFFEKLVNACSLLFPPYLFPKIMFHLVLDHKFRMFCQSYEDLCDSDKLRHIQYYCCPEKCQEQEVCVDFHQEVVGKLRKCMMVHAVVWCFILIQIELGVFQMCMNLLERLWYKKIKKWSCEVKPCQKEQQSRTDTSSSKASRDPSTLPGVDLELTDEDAINLSDKEVNPDGILMRKIAAYGTQISNIKDFTVWIPKGDIFCFVGTENLTTARLLAILGGSRPYASGDVVIYGKPFRTSDRKPKVRVGYCPLVDAHLAIMTGYETLAMHARLRGVPEAEVDSLVESLLKVFFLFNVARKPISMYSEGKQRRLSIAVALVGTPDILLLNDPIGKLDLISKDIFWKAIKDINSTGRTIVMTYNSIEEIADKVSRIAVMIEGKLMCSAPPALLRKSYCNSYTLMAQIDSMNRIVSNKMLMFGLMERFPNALVKVDQRYVNIIIPYEDESLADIFNVMESCKKHLKIADYKLTHTNLNHVMQAFESSRGFDTELSINADEIDMVEDLMEDADRKSIDS